MSVPIRSLPEWLTIATDNLCNTAKERITLEIGSHFQDAVEVYRTSGEDECQARVHAVADLGDPQTSRKQFRKIHLTEMEAKDLSDAWFGHPRRGAAQWLLRLCSVAVYIAQFFLMRKHHVPLLFPAIMGVALGVLNANQIWIWCHITRCRYTPSVLRRFYTAHVLEFLISLPFFGLYAVWVNWPGYFVILVPASVKMARTICLCVKLWRMEDFSRELLPRGSAGV